jgi:competence protein ComEA
VDERGWQAAAWGLAAIVAVVLGVRLLGSDPPSSASVAIERPDQARDASRTAGPYVHVAGAVRRPGLYRLREGARVAAAVRRAGGASARADLTAINLAAHLEDGQQVIVPAADAAQGPDPSGGSAISLGSATVAELDQLDGIGPTLAQRIVEHRQASGGFASVDDLAEVDGIGEKRLAALEEALAP